MDDGMTPECGFTVFYVDGKRRVRMTHLYNVWSSMRNRCTNPHNHAWRRYGGRGISICAEWDDFATFQAWAKSAGYAKGLYIDRTDNEKNYSPDNCRWVSARESTLNRSAVRLNAEMAEAIRADVGTHSQIAAKHGISREHARDIRNGKRWRTA